METTARPTHPYSTCDDRRVGRRSLKGHFNPRTCNSARISGAGHVYLPKRVECSIGDAGEGMRLTFSLNRDYTNFVSFSCFKDRREIPSTLRFILGIASFRCSSAKRLADELIVIWSTSVAPLLYKRTWMRGSILPLYILMNS